MPYKSKAQLRFMHAKHPKIAERWDDKYGPIGELPEHVKRGKKMSRGEHNKKNLMKGR